MYVQDVRFWINLADFVDLFQDVSLQDETLLDVACIIKGVSAIQMLLQQH